MDGFGILGSQKISECNAVPTRRSGAVGPILATALFRRYAEYKNM
jgi:hypothetical protein